MRFPYAKRLSRTCIDCGGRRSRQSALGQGRCRNCYFQYRRANPKYASNNKVHPNPISVVGRGKGRRKTRPVDRPGIASCIYPDRYGIGHYADEEVFQGLTAAAAWSCLRKSWKGYKIAAGKMDEERKVMYAQRIVGLCRLLDLDEPEFLELYAWPTWHEVGGGVWVPSYYQHGFVYQDGASFGYGYNNNSYNNYWNSQNLYRWY